MEYVVQFPCVVRSQGAIKDAVAAFFPRLLCWRVVEATKKKAREHGDGDFPSLVLVFHGLVLLPRIFYFEGA